MVHSILDFSLHNLLNNYILEETKKSRSDFTHDELIEMDFMEFMEVCSEDELNQVITKERIDSYHRFLGEDLIDQQGTGLVSHQAFSGWFMHKYPERSISLLDLLSNEMHADIQTILEFYSEEFEEGEDLFYNDLVEFTNLTRHTKRRLNVVLIQWSKNYEG